MGPWNKQRLLFVLGYFIIVLHSHYVDSYEHERHSKRIKRFLFNKVEEPDTVYSNVTLCCICNDFDKTNTCYEKCRDRREEDLCQRGTLCSTTATLLNDRFYLTTDCVSKDTCRQERAVYGQTQGCLTLNKTDVKNGTKCGYCCQNRDVTSAALECRHNLDHLMNHVYGQNAGTTEKTVTPNSCQGSECQVSKFNTVTRLTTNKLALSTNHSWTDYIYKLCTSKVALDGKLYFPFPDDNRYFIECDKAGQGTITRCPATLVWNDLKVACDFIFNIITKVATKPLSTMFKTTLQSTAKSTSSSSSLSQLLSSSQTKLIQKTSPPSFSSSSRQMSSPASATSSVSKSTTSSPLITKPASTLSPTPVSTNTSTVTTKSTLNPLSSEPTLGQNEAICETCTNGTDCIVSKCQANHFYCLNVVIINSQGKQTVLKKSCANIYECKYDHSLRNSECGSQGASRLVKNMSLTCQYCCNATSNPIACNADTIPQNITWFENIASTTSTVEPYTLLNTTEYSSSDSTVSATSSGYNFSSTKIQTYNITTKKSVTLSTNYSSEVHFNTTLNGFTTSAMQPSSMPSNISTNNYRSSTTSPQSSSTNATISSFKNTSIKVNSQGFSTNVTKSPLTTPLTTRLTSRISSVPQKFYTTTTSQAVRTSTKPPPYTIPPRTTKCKVCSGPAFLCEKLFIEKDCAPPNNYCINTVSNQKDGKRLVDRRCDNFQTCYRDWFLGSSDSDKCRRFDERYTLTLQFDCTFCCITDNCNEHIRPSDETLYKDL